MALRPASRHYYRHYQLYADPDYHHCHYSVYYIDYCYGGGSTTLDYAIATIWWWSAILRYIVYAMVGGLLDEVPSSTMLCYYIDYIGGGLLDEVPSATPIRYKGGT